MKKRLLSLIACACLGTSAQAQIVNPGMETWINYTSGFPPATLERPTAWFGTDSIITNLSLLLGFTAEKQLIKSSDAHSGSFAAKIITKEQGTLGNVPGMLMNAEPIIGILDSSFAFNGGTPITGWVDSVFAWVNYTHPGAPGADQAQMSAYAFKTGAGAGGTDSMVGSGEYMIDPTSDYTKVALKMNYTSPLMPDKIVILFSSSPFSTGSGLSFDGLPGSTLFVDDVSMVMGTLNVPTVCFGSNEIFAYPNPAKDVWHLYVPMMNNELSLEVFNTAGQKVAAQHFTSNLTLSTAAFPAGMYLYHLRNSNGQVLKSGKIQIAR